MRSILARLSEEVTALAAVPVSGLPVGSLQELVAGCAGLANRLAGISARALGELQVRGQGIVPDPSEAGASLPTAAWLRHAAGTTGTAAGREIRTSVALRELPAVVEAIVDGAMTARHGHALARLVGRIEPQALLDSQPQLIEVARRCDPHQMEQYVSHLIATWCASELAEQEMAAEERRFLQLRNQHNGSWRGSFELPDAAMEIVLTALEPLARRTGDTDARPAGQRRADALTDVFALALRHGELPDAGGSRPLLTYVVPAWWTPELAAAMRRLSQDPLATAATDGTVGAVGLAATAAGPFALEATAAGRFALDLDRHPGRDVATAPWTGPATASRIATLLCESRVQRVVLDADGQVVSLESVTDDVTAAQRRAVAARDRCCVTKGCTRPPAFCDVHHLRARADGGRSTVGNLVLLCRRHHVMWHRDQLALTELRVPWMRLPQPQPQPSARARAPALE